MAKSGKPNILIIWGDDIGWFNVSMNNQGIMGYRTPNIDRVAKELAAKEADLAVDDPPPDPLTLTRGVYAGDDFAVPRLEFMASPFRS